MLSRVLQHVWTITSCIWLLQVSLVKSVASQAGSESASQAVLQAADSQVDFYPPLFYGTTWGRESRTVGWYRSSLYFHRVLMHRTSFSGPLHVHNQMLNAQRGEPLNVIISGRSHPSVLSDAGLLRFVKKLGFEPECLNLHIGDPQNANLRDGNGWQEQLLEIRQAYFPIFGTCFQSAVGGNHFRAWKQNGTLADSGAWFLAVSTEHDYRKNHMMWASALGRKVSLICLQLNLLDSVTEQTTATTVGGI